MTPDLRNQSTCQPLIGRSNKSDHYYYDGPGASLARYVREVLAPDPLGFTQRHRKGAEVHLAKLLSAPDSRFCVRAARSLPRAHPDPTEFRTFYLHFSSQLWPRGVEVDFGFARLWHGRFVPDRGRSVAFLGIETVQGLKQAATTRLCLETKSRQFMLEWIVESAKPLLASGWQVGLSTSSFGQDYQKLGAKLFDTTKPISGFMRPSVHAQQMIPVSVWREYFRLKN